MSRRMGPVNKLLLPFRGTTLVETTFRHLAEAGIGPVTVVTGHEADLVTERLKHSAARILHNPRYEEGMTTSIQAGVAVAPPHATGYMICPGDLPFILPQEYRQIASFFDTRLSQDPQAIVQAVFEGQAGHPVVFSAAHRAAILSLSYPEGCRPVVQAHLSALYPFAFATDHCVRDVDRQEEYTRYTHGEE